MIHTPQIIERSIATWSEWLGKRISGIAVSMLSPDDEIAEVRVNLAGTEHRYFISWQQEDGPDDNLSFHWLSLQRSSHFGETCLAHGTAPSILTSLVGVEVDTIDLYGERHAANILAAIVNQNGSGFGIATARNLPNRSRLSRFGVSDLAIVDATVLQNELLRQQIENIVTLVVEKA